MFSYKRIYLRLKIILTGALFRLLLSFSNLIISLFIIRTQSAELWGNIVYYLLILDLGFSVINWGHVPYLNREFSLYPSLIKEKFRKSFFSRCYLLLLFAAVLWLMPIPARVKSLLTAWSLARFVYQAFDPVIQYNRKYIFSLIVESTGILIVVIPILISWVEPSVYSILRLFTASFIFRSVVMVIFNQNLFDGTLKSFTSPSLSGFIVPAFPFLLLTFSAMLQQRADLYVVAIYLQPAETAHYQVFVNLLLLGQLGASLLLSPFSKNIFRLPKQSFQKLERNFTRAGIFLTFCSTGFIYLVVRFIYGFELSWTLYAMAYFYGLLFYFYLLRNYQLGKAYRQVTVALYSFAGFAVNLVLSFIFTPHFGIAGALLAGLLTQIFITALYFTNPFLKEVYAPR